jgi:hypothetical protein
MALKLCLILFVRYTILCCDTAGLKHNGPAIKGGCVTRRKHRADPGTLAAKQSRCKEGKARVFAVQVQILLNITRVAVQV